MDKKNKSKSKKVLFIILIVVAILIYMVPTIFVVGNVVYSIFDKQTLKKKEIILLLRMAKLI